MIKSSISGKHLGSISKLLTNRSPLRLAPLGGGQLLPHFLQGGAVTRCDEGRLVQRIAERNRGEPARPQGVDQLQGPERVEAAVEPFRAGRGGPAAIHADPSRRPRAAFIEVRSKSLRVRARPASDLLCEQIGGVGRIPGLSECAEGLPVAPGSICIEDLLSAARVLCVLDPATQ